MINGVDIQSVAFAPGQIEIVYAEARDTDSQSGILELRTLILPSQVVEDAAMEALDAIQQLLDAALLAKRSPLAVMKR